MPTRFFLSAMLGALVILLAGAPSNCRADELLVSSRFSNSVLRYNVQTGAFLGTFAAGGPLANPNGIAVGADGNLYVGLGDTGKVLRYNGMTRAYMGEFVTGGGGLAACRAISFGPDGNLYVCSGTTGSVNRYNGRTGEFMDVFASGHGLNGPVGLTFGKDGTCYVGGALSNAVYAFDQSGNFLRSFSHGPTDSNCVGVLEDKAGNLLVAQSVTNRVLKFNPQTGAYLGIAAQGAGLNIPIGMIFLPSGDLLVGSFNNDRAIKYNLTTGVGSAFILPGSGGLDGTHNFAIIPGQGVVVLFGAAGLTSSMRRRRGEGLSTGARPQGWFGTHRVA